MKEAERRNDVTRNGTPLLTGCQCPRIRRRNVSAPKPASANAAPSSPHGVSVGAAAVVLAHIPTRLVRLHRIDGSVQAVSQQTPLAQKPVPHCEGVAHAPP